jgi:hypothetical protein
VTRLRGIAAGLLTAALGLAAHGAASGLMPSGAGAALLCVLAATVGALAATADRASDARVLLALLTSGQLIAHVTLAITGHHHGSLGAPSAAMLGAHLIALIVGAVLIAAGDRLCRAICAAVRDVARRQPCPILSAAAVPTVAADQPLRSALLLAASVSHRGPPVSPSR